MGTESAMAIGVEHVRPRLTVFIVDDDVSVRKALCRLLRWEGLDVVEFASAEEFLASGRLSDPGCLVLDVYLPGANGLELQRRLNALGCGLRIIFITGTEDQQTQALVLQR